MATARVVPFQEERKLRTVAAAKLKPETIDDKAKQFLALKLQESSIADQIENAEAELLKLVERFGVRPAKADKSKRVNGSIYYAQATYGANTNVDPQAVERFMLAMVEAGMDKKLAADLFESIFVFSPKYSLATGALKVITGKLPKGSPRNLRHLFHQAVTVTPKKPSLKVDEIKKGKQ